MPGYALCIDFHSDGRDLGRLAPVFGPAPETPRIDIRLNPDAGEARNLPGGHPKLCQRCDDHALQSSHIADIVGIRYPQGISGSPASWRPGAADLSKRNQWRAHELPGPVIRYVTASIDPPDLHPSVLELMFRPEKVLGTALSTERVDMGMFKQQQGRRPLARCDLPRIGLLHLPGGVVFDHAEVQHLTKHAKSH